MDYALQFYLVENVRIVVHMYSDSRLHLAARIVTHNMI